MADDPNSATDLHPGAPRKPAEPDSSSSRSNPASSVTPCDARRPREYGGRKGLDPVRYGDWEKNGRCIDF